MAVTRQASPLPDGALAWASAELGELRANEALPGGAGRRRYWRLHGAAGGSWLFAHALPEDPAILPPALRAPGARVPFVTITELLARHGVPVPKLLAWDEERLWLLLEDLGNRHLLDLCGEEQRCHLGGAVDLLAHVHAIAIPADSLPAARRYDAEWIAFEQSLFLARLPAKSAAALRDAFAALTQELAALPTVLSLRDYQSHNLMIDASGALRVIDYQDALQAPRELDLVSLLYDSYLELDELRDPMLERYQRASEVDIDRAALACFVVQRKTKDLVRFLDLAQVRGERLYLPAARRAKAALQSALPALPAAHRRLAQGLPAALEALT